MFPGLNSVAKIKKESFNHKYNKYNKYIYKNNNKWNKKRCVLRDLQFQLKYQEK